ncbi:Uncharacterised protein [Vibrio cholerae]|nr:Uncharacterised protein [Vibrio cholerae]
MCLKQNRVFRDTSIFGDRCKSLRLIVVKYPLSKTAKATRKQYIRGKALVVEFCRMFCHTDIVTAEHQNQIRNVGLLVQLQVIPKGFNLLIQAFTHNRAQPLRCERNENGNQLPIICRTQSVSPLYHTAVAEAGRLLLRRVRPDKTPLY